MCNGHPIYSVLKPFVYDPLVEWSKTPRGQRQPPTDTGEITNEQVSPSVPHVSVIKLDPNSHL